jgi:Flp pilus assembly protein TadB
MIEPQSSIQRRMRRSDRQATMSGTVRVFAVLAGMALFALTYILFDVAWYWAALVAIALFWLIPIFHENAQNLRSTRRIRAIVKGRPNDDSGP